MGNSSSKSKDGTTRPGSAASSGIAKFKKTLGGNKHSDGRVLGSSPAPAQAPTAPAPVPKTTGGKTLGGGSPPAEDARASAAKAAEERANKAAGRGGKGGKLQSQLAAQKKQTRTQTLDDVSKQNQRSRDADEAAEARTWA